MKPVGEEGLKDLQPGTKVGYSRHGSHSSGKRWNVIGIGVVDSKPKADYLPINGVVIAITKIYFQQNISSALAVGEKLLTLPEFVYLATELCSTCKGSGEEVCVQENAGHLHPCTHCGGVGLEPLEETKE